MTTYIGILLGYIIGLKIWDFYFEKIILPKIKKQRRIDLLNLLKCCKIIGNPKIGE